MNIQKATEIVALEKNKSYEGDGQDLEVAMTIALVCMSYCDAIIRALGEAEMARLRKGD